MYEIENVTVVIKDPSFNYGKFNSTTPSATFDQSAISIHIDHYKMSGRVLVVNFAGEGTMEWVNISVDIPEIVYLIVYNPIYLYVISICTYS